MAGGCDLRVVRLFRFEGESKLKAFVDIAIGDFVIKGLRVLEGKKGLFLGMPQDKAKNGKWYSVFYPISKEARQSLCDAVLTAFKE